MMMICVLSKHSTSRTLQLFQQSLRRKGRWSRCLALFLAEPCTRSVHCKDPIGN